jgi:hypothetical protein
MMNKYKKILGLIALYCSLPILLVTTAPNTLPLPLLMVPFILLFITLFTTVVFASRHLSDGRTTRRRIYILSGMVAAAPVLLLVFQSLHQLSIIDVFITVTLLVGSGFYISRIDFSP